MSISANRKISVIGLGYVGLPVAAAFAAKGRKVIAFDIDAGRIEELKNGHDRTLEVDPAALGSDNLSFTAAQDDLAAADFHIIAVPTPIDEAHKPDLTPLLSASATVGRVLKPGDIVVYESSVYPGATEEVCVPALERASGLTFGTDFTVGYSPERVNPGDREHRFETIVKVVSASDPATTDIVADAYESVVEAGVYRAPSIKVAEAAKILENTQRDINIALINEVAIVLDRLDVDTRDVLATVSTKWNFLPFHPGLVGGHCIGVDPYYLTYKAEQVGYHPEVILSGRRVNNQMGHYVANRIVRNLMRRGWDGTPRIAILGVTFKPDVPDTRNTRVADMARELMNFGMEVQLHDPMADAAAFEREYGLSLTPLEDMPPADAVVLAVGHRQFRDLSWSLIEPLAKDRAIVADLSGALDRDAVPEGVTLWRL